MKYSIVLALAAIATPAVAQVGRGPQPAPAAPAIEAPRDRAFQGAIEVVVDATDTIHKIFRVRETVPVQAAGSIVLLYPRWETSSHAPTGPIAGLAGLTVRSGRRLIEWRRDPVDVFAFHLEVPPGASELAIEFQLLSPSSPREGAMLMTPNIITVPWQNLIVYPAGWFTRDLMVQASLTVPPGFQQVSGLEVASTAGSTIQFQPTSLEALVDAPVFAGRHVQRIELGARGEAPVALDLVADTPGALAISPAALDRYRRLIAEGQRLFGARHYRHYDFLVSLSDQLPSGGGLEHLQSSENNLAADFFTDPANHVIDSDILPHEYVHSWNGRFRQPADLWAPNFNVPVRNSLLWVYEGQTELWGKVLAARIGFRTRQQTLDMLALDAALAQGRPGRIWKSLQDSTNDALYMVHRPIPWRDWQRREDYYGEGVLLWLAVDAVMRQRSGEQRGLDDFARAFFAGKDGDLVTSTYTFEDVCDALNRLVPYDWAAFLRNRLESHAPEGLLDGLTRGGYRLIFTDSPTAYYQQHEREAELTDLAYSVGLAIDHAGVVKAVAWEGPAFRAGLSIGARLLTVNGEAYSADRMIAAVRAAGRAPIDVAFQHDGEPHTARIDYHGSLRYPRLERIPGTRARLDALLTGPATPGSAR